MYIHFMADSFIYISPFILVNVSVPFDWLHEYFSVTMYTGYTYRNSDNNLQNTLILDNARRTGYEEGKEKGGTDGKTIGEAEGIQMAEEECQKELSELLEDCQKEIDMAVAAILQEELDGRQNAIDITASGFTTDAAAQLRSCIIRNPCTSDDTASCKSVQIDGTDLCITTSLVV